MAIIFGPRRFTQFEKGGLNIFGTGTEELGRLLLPVECGDPGNAKAMARFRQLETSPRRRSIQASARLAKESRPTDGVII